MVPRAPAQGPGRRAGPRLSARAVGSPATSPASSSSGWAPDDWDQLAKRSGCRADLLRDNGLGFQEQARPDAGRVPGARAVPDLQREQRGGRDRWPDPAGLPDPAKYKNSPETPIYTKSKTLYGLNWAKGDVVQQNRSIVCEGYTDVIGFHRAGVPRAVATCGTAFTEEHVRLLKNTPPGSSWRSTRTTPARARPSASTSGRRSTRSRSAWRRSRRARTRASSPRATPTRSRRGPGRHAVPAVPARPRRRRPADELARGRGAAGRAGDGGGQRAPQRQRPQAVRGRGGAARRPSGRRSRRSRGARQRLAAGPGQSSPAAAGAPRERRVRRDLDARSRAGTRSPRSWSSVCSPTRRTAVPSSPSPRPVATSSPRSSWPTRRRVTSSSAPPSWTSRSTWTPRPATSSARPCGASSRPVPSARHPSSSAPTRRRACEAWRSCATSERGLDAAGWLLGWLEARMEARTGGVEPGEEMPTVEPPVEGVDRSEWNDLVTRGRDHGELLAEYVAHVLRHVELTGDTLQAVQASLHTHGIAVDDAVDDVDDETPTEGVPRPVALDDEDVERLLTRRRRRRGQKRAVRVDGGTSDTVRLYLREIGLVDLLVDRGRTASRPADRGGSHRGAQDRRGHRGPVRDAPPAARRAARRARQERADRRRTCASS